MADDCSANPFALLVRLADSLRTFMDNAAAEFGLTPPQAHALLILDMPLHMSALAERKLCDPSSVTSLVKRLEHAGLVQRVVDPHDRRARLVRLTPKGRRLRARLQQRLADAQSVLDDLTDQQRHALAAFFASTNSPQDSALRGH